MSIFGGRRGPKKPPDYKPQPQIIIYDTAPADPAAEIIPITFIDEIVYGTRNVLWRPKLGHCFNIVPAPGMDIPLLNRACEIGTQFTDGLVGFLISKYATSPNLHLRIDGTAPQVQNLNGGVYAAVTTVDLIPGTGVIQSGEIIFSSPQWANSMKVLLHEMVGHMLGMVHVSPQWNQYGDFIQGGAPLDAREFHPWEQIAFTYMMSKQPGTLKSLVSLASASFAYEETLRCNH